MQPLNHADLLRVFDQTAGQPPLEAAKALLAAACPEEPRGGFDGLPVGRFAARLLALYRQAFGPVLELASTCPECGEAVDFQLAIGDLLVQVPADDGTGVQERVIDGLVLRFRLVTGADLAAVADLNTHEGRRQLIERCLVEARRNGEPEPPGDLSEEEIAALGAAVLTCDPLAEVLLDLVCPACDRAWQARLDVAACLNQELDTAARRLLEEVHTLGRGYGWREAEILAMGARRRRTYLEMLSR